MGWTTSKSCSTGEWAEGASDEGDGAVGSEIIRARCSFSARFRYDSFKLPTLKSINNYTNKNEIIMHPKRK
jgi:hypothetical protein